jgi:chemotaxis protein histidine kinase CheA/ActR/RegA family two-component response regulator
VPEPQVEPIAPVPPAVVAADDQPGPDPGMVPGAADGQDVVEEEIARLAGEARSLDLDSELRGVLIADLSDIHGRIQELALGLGGGDDARILHELGRCYHTLKGAAGSVGLIGLAGRIHALEDQLEQAGGRVSAGLMNGLEGSLVELEAVLAALGGSGSSGSQAVDAATSAGIAEPRDEGERAPGPRAEEPDGLIRVPADRFEELTDLCSELLTRRKAWAEHAEQMKRLVHTAQASSHRLRMSVDRLGEGTPRDDRRRGDDRGPRGEDPAGLARRLGEQAEDLAALAAAARESAVSVAEEAETLSRLSVRLWESIQAVRVVPVRALFHRLVRVARDAARVEGREIGVELVGEETGADRLLLDKAYEPLLHVVRNAVGHGIEPPADRARAGKPLAGRITLEARREGNTLVIAVQDDGRGLDYEAIAAKGRRLGLIGPDERPGTDRLNALIFQPGFSTRGQANAISGRGVGMDVVAREVELLRGRVELTSQAGQGTRLAMRLPARLSLEHVMVVRVGGQALAIPTAAIDSVGRDEGRDDEGAAVGDRRPPAAHLGPILGFPESARVPCPTLVIAGAGGEAAAVRVDAVDGPLEMVVRPLGPLLTGHPAISGVGLTTGGEIVLAVDVAGLLRLAHAGPSAATAPTAGDRPRALVVDDSLSVRRIATRNIRALGLEVDEASDGEQALGKLRDRPYRLIVTDLEMPRMDGFALLAELGRTGVLGRTPVVVASTLSDPETRRRVLELGARAYVNKPVVAEELADVVGTILADDGGPPFGRA